MNTSDTAIVRDAQDKAELLNKGLFGQHIEDLAVAGDVQAQTPALVYLDLVLALTFEGILALPVPDSEAKDIPAQSNRKPDKFPTLQITGTKSRKVTGSYYTELARSTTPWLGWQQHRMAIKAVTEGAIPKAAGDLALYDQYKGMVPADLDSLDDTLEQRQRKIATMLKSAVSLAMQLDNFARVLPLIQAEVKMVDEIGQDGKPTGTKVLANVRKPIRVKEKANPDMFRNVSVGQFINYNAEAAALKGGNLTAVIETAGREPNPDDDTPQIPNVDTLQDYLNMILHFMRDKDKRVALYKKLGNDMDFLRTFGDVCSEFDIPYTQFGKAYENITLQTSVHNADNGVVANKVANG